MKVVIELLKTISKIGFEAKTKKFGRKFKKFTKRPWKIFWALLRQPMTDSTVVSPVEGAADCVGKSDVISLMRPLTTNISSSQPWPSFNLIPANSSSAP